VKLPDRSEPTPQITREKVNNKNIAILQDKVFPTKAQRWGVRVAIPVYRVAIPVYRVAIPVYRVAFLYTVYRKLLLFSLLLFIIQLNDEDLQALSKQDYNGDGDVDHGFHRQQQHLRYQRRP
jgi:hypothetical protein